MHSIALYGKPIAELRSVTCHMAGAATGLKGAALQVMT